MRSAVAFALLAAGSNAHPMLAQIKRAMQGSGSGPEGSSGYSGSVSALASLAAYAPNLSSCSLRVKATCQTYSKTGLQVDLMLDHLVLLLRLAASVVQSVSTSRYSGSLGYAVYVRAWSKG